MLTKNLMTSASMLYALAAMSPEGQTGAQEAPKAPPQTPTGDAAKPTEAKTGEAAKPAAKTTAPATAAPKSKAAAKGKAATPKKNAAPAAPAKRESKIAPTQSKVVDMLKKGSATVQAMAAKFNVTERHIRQAIDRARAQGEKINRVSRNTFGYEKARRA